MDKTDLQLGEHLAEMLSAYNWIHTLDRHTSLSVSRLVTRVSIIRPDYYSVTYTRGLLYLPVITYLKRFSLRECH